MAPEGQRGRRDTRSRRAVRRKLRVVVNGGARAHLVPGLGPWLVKTAPASASGLVSVALVSDERIRALNRQYRGRDYATDVLSFPSDDYPTPRLARTPRSEASAGKAPKSKRAPRFVFLGDIVIAARVARRQAREAGHSLLVEAKVLALHGLLHLLGYDHDRDSGEMSRVEH